MKKLLILLAFLFMVTPAEAAVQWWWQDALTGGVSNSLDSISDARISNNAWAAVMVTDPLTGTTSYLMFQYNSGATDTERTSSHPYKIMPDTQPSAGFWYEAIQTPWLSSPEYDTAVMSGSTGDVTVTSSVSGWILTNEELQSYSRFYVETSHPGGEASGATPWSDLCSIGIANSGITVQLPELTTSLHGREWEFTHSHGATAFVLYNVLGRIMKKGTSGTTPGGVAIDSVGDTVKVKAFAPSTTSGISYYFVTAVEAD